MVHPANEQLRRSDIFVENAASRGLSLLLWRRGLGRGGLFSPLFWFIGNGM
jgi:hypothetical protein